MAVHWGGRGPGHMARFTAGGVWPALALDFIGTANLTMSIDFTAEPSGSCVAFETDPSQPSSGFAFFQVRE